MTEADEPFDPNAYPGSGPSSASPYGPSYPPPYSAPPPYAAPQGYPGYPAGPGYQSYPGYPNQPGSAGYPGYAGYAGYPVYPGYPPQGLGRPGVATAANVLAFVNGGLLIIAGLLLFLGASAINSVDNLGGPSHHLLSAELAFDGLLDLAASGMLIAGGVTLGNRRSSGRVLLGVGGGIVLGESLYWLIRTHGIATFWALLFGALAVVSLCLAWSKPVTAWLTTSP